MKSALALLALLALAVAPARASGFAPTSGLAGWYDDDPLGSSLRLAPTVALDAPRATLVGGAMLSGSEKGDPYRGARLAGGWLGGPLARLPLELRLEAAHRGGPATPDRGLMRAEARLHFGVPGYGAWMAVASERTVGFSGAVLDPLIGFGAWSRQGGFTVLFDLEQRAGLLPRARPLASPPDSQRMSAGLSDGALQGNQVLNVALTTTRATLRWEGSRLALESVGGVTLSPLRTPRRWAQATAVYQLLPDVAVFATAGSRDPELYLIEPAESPRTTLGFRLSRWRSTAIDAPLNARARATGFEARRLDGESWSLAVRAPGARLVEVTGDFTGWEPLRLEHAGGDRWQALVTLLPGVHQMNLRVDGGAWTPPPGAPTTVDSFGGTVGVVATE